MKFLSWVRKRVEASKKERLKKKVKELTQTILSQTNLRKGFKQVPFDQGTKTR